MPPVEATKSFWKTFVPKGKDQLAGASEKTSSAAPRLSQRSWMTASGGAAKSCVSLVLISVRTNPALSCSGESEVSDTDSNPVRTGEFARNEGCDGFVLPWTTAMTRRDRMAACSRRESLRIHARSRRNNLRTNRRSNRKTIIGTNQIPTSITRQKRLISGLSTINRLLPYEILSKEKDHTIRLNVRFKALVWRVHSSSGQTHEIPGGIAHPSGKRCRQGLKKIVLSVPYRQPARASVRLQQQFETKCLPSVSNGRRL